MNKIDVKKVSLLHIIRKNGFNINTCNDKNYCVSYNIYEDYLILDSDLDCDFYIGRELLSTNFFIWENYK